MGHAAGDADGREDAEVVTAGGRDAGNGTREPGSGVRLALRVAIGVIVLSALSVCAGFAQTWRTLSSARQVHGERALTVHVEYGAGRFSLAPGPAGTLYRMDMKYDEERDQPIREYDPVSGTLHVGVRTETDHHVSLGGHHRDQPSSLDIALAPGLPLDLDIEIGAAEANLDFGGLTVRSLRYKTGASQSNLRFASLNPGACDELSVDIGAAALHATGLANANCRRMRFSGGVGEVELDFSGEWHHPIDATVNVGIGTLKLQVPRDVGVAIRLNRFLASFESAGFTKRGDTYYSGNFETAHNRLTLDVNATLGGVEVNWID